MDIKKSRGEILLIFLYIGILSLVNVQALDDLSGPQINTKPKVFRKGLFGKDTKKRSRQYIQRKSRGQRT